jgi:orotidine-5'-phosphate decarboxylase
MRPDQLIAALDIPDPHKALMMVQTLMPTGCMFKVGGLLAAVAATSSFRLQSLGIPGGRLMLDLKVFETPDSAVKILLQHCYKLQPRFVTVPLPYNHPSVAAAIKALKGPCPDTVVLGVTVPTSMGLADVRKASGHAFGSFGAVEHFAYLGVRAGLEGIVCSAHERADMANTDLPNRLKYFVVPGIRPEGTDPHDQIRVATPAQALAAGATHLVVGRPITEAADPLAAVHEILASAPTP